jgi:hypothetical protein
MNTKEKTYMMALAALLLIGLSTAWAGYSSLITISGGTPSAALQVSQVNPTPSLSNLKKGKWFQSSAQDAFTISNVTASSKLYVTVGVTNMGTLATQFSSLEIKVELYASGETSAVASGFISLTGGISSVILEGTGATKYTVKITVSGRPSVDVGSISIEMYCSAIEA